MTTTEKRGNVHIFERMATRDRVVSMENGAPTFARGTPAPEAKKILEDRIESGKERYDGELTFSHVEFKEGWMVAEAIYASKRSPMIIHAVVNADGSCEGY